jgi:hypothetical protein
MSWLSRPAFALGLALASLVACGDDENEDAPSAPPEVRIVAVQHVGGPRAELGSETVQLGCDPSAPLLVETEITTVEGGFTLRPPGGCGSARYCGYIAAYVDDSGLPAAQAAAPSLLVAVPEYDDASHVLRVELRSGAGLPIPDAAGSPVADEVTFRFAAAQGCGSAGAGGSAGASGAGGSAGASGAGGSAGASGAGGASGIAGGAGLGGAAGSAGSGGSAGLGGTAGTAGTAGLGGSAG